jgi:hypothetical protein
MTREKETTAVCALRDKGYQACLKLMGDCAQRWLATHGRKELSFTLPPQYMAVICNLDALVERLSPTQPGRAFLRALDDASGQEATVMQACAIIRALYLPITEWSESECAELMKRAGAPS